MTQELELVNHPKHYDRCADETRSIVEVLGVPERWHDVECIVAIESLAYVRCDFHTATALRYLWRYGQKSIAESELDLRKAIWYIDRRNELFPSGKARGDKAIALIQELLGEAAA